MASGVEYREIKGRDEKIPVFRNLSRSVVKRGADKIYWRMKATAEKRLGSWDDVVWLDCETGDVRFGERFVREGWSDIYDYLVERAKKWSASRDDFTYRAQIVERDYGFEPSFCPFDKNFALEYWDDKGRGGPYSYLGIRKLYDESVHVWPLGVLSEWRGPDAEIEPRLAARLAEAAEFNFGLGFDGPEEEAEDDPFLKNANEIIRFYEARNEYRRKKSEEARKNDASNDSAFDSDEEEDESEFQYWESDASFEDWRKEEKTNEENDENRFDYWDNAEFASEEKGKYVPKKKTENGKEVANVNEENDETKDVEIYWNAEEIKRFWMFWINEEIVYKEPLRIFFYGCASEFENEDATSTTGLSEEARTVVFHSKSEERRRALKRGFEFWRNWWSSQEEPVYLGTLEQMVAVAKAGTSGRTALPKSVEAENGEIVFDYGAERSDALSDDWRERLPSLIAFRYDCYRAYFDAAKTVYTGVVGTPVRSMKKLGVWVTPGCDTTALGAERPSEGANWLKLGTIADFYELKRGEYWGAEVKKAKKIKKRHDARHWLAGEISRRLEAALNAEK